jgi:cell wall-associated NlpC family hydrolase
MKHKCLSLAVVLCAGAAAPVAAVTETTGRAEDRPMIQALLSLGVRYRHGGYSPATGFDCSGLVKHVFDSAWGLQLPRRVQEQRALGIPVDRSELHPGDLIFYNTRKRAYSHVGIYLGDGKFIHAPRAGGRVRTENLNNPYWRARFNGARRLEPAPEG